MGDLTLHNYPSMMEVESCGIIIQNYTQYIFFIEKFMINVYVLFFIKDK